MYFFPFAERNDQLYLVISFVDKKCDSETVFETWIQFNLNSNLKRADYTIQRNWSTAIFIWNHAFLFQSDLWVKVYATSKVVPFLYTHWFLFNRDRHERVKLWWSQHKKPVNWFTEQINCLVAIGGEHWLLMVETPKTDGYWWLFVTT